MKRGFARGKREEDESRMVKNMKRIIAVIIIFCSAVLAYIAFPWAGMFLGIVLMPNPPKPEITYGEFPCKLVYETDGETKVIEDTVICEFDGFENFGTAGKDRSWKTTLKSGNENLTLLNMRSSNETNELGQPILELYFYYGNAAYYMGDDTYPHSA